jgi:hypothetical protein
MNAMMSVPATRTGQVGAERRFRPESQGTPRVGILAVVGHYCRAVHLCCSEWFARRLGRPSICCRIRATRGNCPVSGCRALGRLLGCEAVCNCAKESCRDQDRCDESKHSIGIHGRFPRVEIIKDSCAIYSPPVERVFPWGAPMFQVKREFTQEGRVRRPLALPSPVRRDFPRSCAHSR